MHNIIWKVQDNSLHDDWRSEENLGSKFYNFFLDKITKIRNILKDHCGFGFGRKGGPGRIEFNYVSDYSEEKIIGKGEATSYQPDSISFKFKKRFEKIS